MNILDSLIPIAEMVAHAIGDYCSVAIHDLSHPLYSVYHVVNGELIGQHKGDSLGLAMEKLLEGSEDSIINYLGYYNGHAIKSSKVLIRNEESKIIGCFCINIIIDDFLKARDTLDKVCATLPLFSVAGEVPKATADDEVSEMCRTIIANSYKDYMSNKTTLTRQERMDFVNLLEEKGVFKVKGSVELLANIMGLSKFTIYSYIRSAEELEKEEN